MNIGLIRFKTAQRFNLPPDGIAHCGECGEYLGDYVSGVLYKFGQPVTTVHLCRQPGAIGVRYGFIGRNGGVINEVD